MDPGDRDALAALDPASATCVMQFRTPCSEDGDCTYADTVCAVGSICPGATLISAACADRSAFSESPCACTALQELAALSPSLPTTAPWNDLAGAAYCQDGSDLGVVCATVDGVQLPAGVNGDETALVGAISSSIGDLGPALVRVRGTEREGCRCGD